ncbi:MAG TPA: hypothetical protein VF803_03775 [Candidatus Paceibacterota bacterium]
MTRTTFIRELLKDTAIVIASVAIALVACTMLLSKMNGIRSSVDESRSAIQKAAAQRADYAQMNAILAQIGSSDAQIKNAFPPVDDISGFMSFMTAFGIQNGVQESFHLSASTPSPVADGVFPISKVAYSISVQSKTLTDTLNYLRNFETVPYMTGLTDGLTVTPGAGDIHSASITFSGNGSLYLADHHGNR